MNRIKHLTVLLTALFLLPFTVVLPALQGETSNPAESYPELEWRRIPPKMINGPPELKSGEEIDLYQGAVWADGNIIWVLNYSDKTYGLLSWEIESGKTKRLHLSKDRIRSIAYDKKEGLLAVRFARAIHYYSPDGLKKLKEKPFDKLIYHWSPMTITTAYLITRDKKRDLFILYDRETLQKIKEIRAPKEKTQRLIPAGEHKIYLWSSYWGSYLYLFDLETGTITEKTKVYLQHRPFFKVVSIENEKIGVFDPLTGTFEFLIKVNKGWIPIQNAWVYGDGLAYRYAPKEHTIEGTYSIKSSEDLPAQRIAIVIPPVTTYGQTIIKEEFPLGNTIQYDKLGNRYLLYDLPPLKKGETIRRLYYRADIIRYKVLFNVPAILGETANITVPKNLHIYLQDEEIYDLDHPEVEKTYQDYFADIKTLAGKIRAIYEFAVHEIDGVWDGRSEPTPGVLKNRHGGCTEHSRVQISMLRKAGIPARFNWNWIPQKDSTLPEMNHKHAEAWLPGTGWIPLEPLGGGRFMAGSAVNYHLIWGVRENLGTTYTHRMDRLAHYQNEPVHKTFKAAPIEISWKITEK